MAARLAWCVLRERSVASQNARPCVIRSVHSTQFDWEDDDARRQWLEAFRTRALEPGSSCRAEYADAAHVDVSYARSSGPGGQNVNKRAPFIYVC